MTTPGRCASCGLPLDTSDPGDLCPACLPKLGLAAGALPTGDDTPGAAAALDSAAATQPWAGSPGGPGPSTSLTPSRGVPHSIGPYRIVRLLGEGGMGMVYLAEQEEPIRRTVALKLIKVGMDTQEVVARFEAERRALALMDHPNIAVVFEAGATADGRPYFVMEYAPGVPLTEYCDAHRLGTRARLQLFIGVCAAIQHAHQKGIIHRDLKPSNVLVIEQDGRPVPKVIDFGIAKATSQRLSERTMFTQRGRLVGTPEYMSPEQADAGAVDLDTRTDIYSLGVMLYELLVGTLPFSATRLREAGYVELLRIIREEEPARPSVRLTTAGTSAREVAAQRRTKVPTLAQELRGDLDWVTLKALEKDRARRYASVSEFAADLTRYLADEPVTARPPSLGYRVQKLVRRHRLAVTASAVVALAVVAGLVVSSVLYVRAERARVDADRQRATAEQQRQRADTASQTAEARAASEARQRAVAEAATKAEVQAREGEAAHRAVAERAMARAESSLYFNNIAMVQLVWTTNDNGYVDQLLAEAPQHLRGWEWHHLSRLNHMEAAAIPIPGTSVVALQTDRSGRTFSAATADFRVLVGDLRTRRVVGAVRLDGVPPASEIRGPIFSRDGRSLAAVVGRMVTDRRIVVWNTGTGEVRWSAEVGSFAGPLAFTPDGSSLVAEALSLPPHLAIWNADTGAERIPVGTVFRFVRAMAFDREGSRLAMTDSQSSRILDTATGRVVVELDLPVPWPGTPVQLAFGADGALVAAVLTHQTLLVWDARTGKPLWWSRVQTPVDSEGILSTRLRAAFTPDGLRLVVSLPDRSVSLLDAKTGTTTARWTGHTGRVTSLVVPAEGKSVLTGGEEGVVRVWDIPVTSPEPAELGSGRDFVTVSVSPSRSVVMAATPDGGFRVWDLVTLQPGVSIPGSGAEWQFPEALALSGPRLLSYDGRGARAMVTRMFGVDTGQGRLASGYELTVRDVRSGAEVARLREPGLSGTEATVAGAPVLDRTPDGLVRAAVIDASGLDSSGTRAVVVSRSMRTAFEQRGNASRAPDSRIDFWDVESRPSVRTVELPQAYVSGLAFAPDGRRVVLLVNGRSMATGEAVGSYAIYDMATGRVRRSWRGARSPSVPPVFDAGGHRVAGISERDEVAIWDAHTGARLATIASQGSAATWLAFSPDGTRLGTLNSDGTVKIFDTVTGRLAVTLQDTSGPCSVREFYVIGRGDLASTPSSVTFSDDGTRVEACSFSTDPRGVKVRLRVWDGSARGAR